mgnify:CR=1 FL=1
MENIMVTPEFQMGLRIVSAVALAFILGFEREITNKYAGLRTHILVSLGACIFTLISIYGFPTFADGDNVILDQATGIRDTGRVAAQVVTGIGFIGAGTVLRNGPTVFGLTTAATLWMAASIGMACGCGLFGIATVSTIVSVGVLTLIRIFERKILRGSAKNIRRLKVTLFVNNDKVDEVKLFMTENFRSVEALKIQKLFENPEKTKISVTVEVVSKKPIQSIYKKIEKLEGVDSISIQGINE